MKIHIYPIILATVFPLSAQQAQSPHHLTGPIHIVHDHEVPENVWAGAATLGYDSRYASEGRDNLDGDGLIHGAAELSYNDLLGGAWFAESPNGPYNEFQCFAEYSIELCDGIEASSASPEGRLFVRRIPTSHQTPGSPPGVRFFHYLVSAPCHQSGLR